MSSLDASYQTVAYKHLASVDLPHGGSNQHELNGVAALQDFFGTRERIKGEIYWQYYVDGEDPQFDTGEYTFYDARESNPSRTEWRLYYSGDFLTRATPGDVLVFTRDVHGRINGLLFQQDSGWLRAAIRFFGLEFKEPRFRTVDQEYLKKRELEIGPRWIAEELQLELQYEPPENDEELVTSEFGLDFPTTAEMSRFAREQSIEYVTDPDQSLITWLDREEQLFLALERAIVEPRLEKGFADVDDFIQYSLSVQNRRKSRMGFAFQNQLSALFNHLRVSYTPQPVTEGRSKPDFIFPGIDEYHDEQIDPLLLTMLGAKSSCKDRWRQILTEADRISQKHLCTLDQTISNTQGDEMVSKNVILVIPAPLHDVYRDFTHPILDVAEFVSLVKERDAFQRNP